MDLIPLQGAVRSGWSAAICCCEIQFLSFLILRFLILKKHKSKEIKDFANTAQVRLGPASLLRLQNFYEIT